MVLGHGIDRKFVSVTLDPQHLLWELFFTNEVKIVINLIKKFFFGA